MRSPFRVPGFLGICSLFPLLISGPLIGCDALTGECMSRCGWLEPARECENEGGSGFVNTVDLEVTSETLTCTGNVPCVRFFYT